MGDRTGIEWTEATWNPVVGCQVASTGCDRCYAAREAAGRLRNLPEYAGLAVKPPGAPARFTGEVRCLPERLDQPLRWRRPRRVFVNSMSDLFHPSVPLPFIVDVFAVMTLADYHTFQVLTKRPQRMAQVVGGPSFRAAVRAAVRALEPTRRISGQWQQAWPLPNVWLGTSVENQEWTQRRIPHLLNTPAAVRWVSAEPLLGPLDLRPWLVAPYHGTRLDWVVVGGESGPGARPMHPDWPRSLRDQCAAAGVPFLFKQWGEWLPAAVEDDDHMAGGRAYNHPDGSRMAAVTREGRGPFRTGTTRLLRPGDETNGGTRMLDPDTVALRVGKKAAGRVLDGVTFDGYPDQVLHA